MVLDGRELGNHRKMAACSKRSAAVIRSSTSESGKEIALGVHQLLAISPLAAPHPLYFHRRPSVHFLEYQRNIFPKSSGSIARLLLAVLRETTNLD